MTDHQQDATATAERCYRPVGKALEDAGLFSTADDTGLYTFAVELLLVPLPAVSLYVRGRDCTLFEAREERLPGSLRRQRIILRLADLIVMDSRLVIRYENMVRLYYEQFFRGFRSGPEQHCEQTFATVS